MVGGGFVGGRGVGLRVGVGTLVGVSVGGIGVAVGDGMIVKVGLGVFVLVGATVA